VQEKESNKKMKQYHDKRFAEEIRIASCEKRCPG
jgi:hypothetical protein